MANARFDFIFVSEPEWPPSDGWPLFFCVTASFLKSIVFTDKFETMETTSLLRKANWVATSILLFTAALVIVSVILISCEPAKSEQASKLDFSNEQLIERGRYLVNTSACHDCHSPKIMTPNGPEPDPERLLSGHPSSSPIPEVNFSAVKEWILFNHDLTAIVGPWGASFAANLTSDETGTGNWTEQQFFTAIRKGKYKGLEGSRDLLPPMPWQVYRNMTDDDLRAIFVYLQTTKPVRNIVPAPIAPDDIPQ